MKSIKVIVLILLAIANIHPLIADPPYNDLEIEFANEIDADIFYEAYKREEIEIYLKELGITEYQSLADCLYIEYFKDGIVKEGRIISITVANNIGYNSDNPQDYFKLISLLEQFSKQTKAIIYYDACDHYKCETTYRFTPSKILRNSNDDFSYEYYYDKTYCEISYSKPICINKLISRQTILSLNLASDLLLREDISAGKGKKIPVTDYKILMNENIDWLTKIYSCQNAKCQISVNEKRIEELMNRIKGNWPIHDYITEGCYGVTYDFKCISDEVREANRRLNARIHQHLIDKNDLKFDSFIKNYKMKYTKYRACRDNECRINLVNSLPI